MKAQDIMTREVATVRPETSVREIAALMMGKNISGVPVVSDDGAIVGIVSEGDLLHRAEVGTERKHKWWFRIFADSDAAAREYAKAHGLAARDVMSRHVISVRDDADLRDVADILDSQRIKRVPVLHDGRLVGIISRRDLVRALAQVQTSSAPVKLENAALHRTLRDRFRSQSWLNDAYINVAVTDGVVELWGLVVSDDQHRALRTLVEETPGVRRVEDRLTVAGPLRGGV
jgi:CBS domain-containing protein